MLTPCFIVIGVIYLCLLPCFMAFRGSHSVTIYLTPCVLFAKPKRKVTGVRLGAIQNGQYPTKTKRKVTGVRLVATERTAPILQ
jgi:hypothetical protein